MLALDRALEDAMPYLFAILGVRDPVGALEEMDPAVRRRRTRDAIKNLMHRESLNQTLSLIFEDLHWVDTETQSLLDLLADSIGTARILMMVNYRPEYEHHWGNKTYYNQLRLDPLGRENAVEMLSELVGDLDDLRGLKGLVVEKTDGNPFFMEELVQALFDQGVLVRDVVVRLAKPLASIQIPPTVQGILTARIDRLWPLEKDLLQTLAVIGKEFPLDLICHVTGRSETEISSALRTLQLAEFVYEKPSFPQTEYTFKHALTQEVSYDSLLIERRGQIHERAASAIEEIYAKKLDDHLSELARHYSRSGNAVKAIKFLRRAAEQARTRSAYDDALRYVNEGLALVSSMPESLERDREEVALEAIHAPLLTTARGFAGAELTRSINRGLELCRRLGEGPEMFPILFGLWGFNLVRNRLRDARSLAERILNLSKLLNDEVKEAAAHAITGAVCVWQGEFSLAREHLDRANAVYDVDVARYLPMHESLVVPSRCHTAWTLWMMGYPEQAHACGERAVALATQLGRPFSMVFALMHAIALAHLRRDYSNIRARAEALIEIARENGFPYWSAVGSMIMGRVLIGEGGHEAGIKRMQEAMVAIRETGGDLVHNYALGLLAEAYLLAGEPAKGLATVAEALRAIESSGQRINEADLLRLRGELLVLAASSDDEAEKSFQSALETAHRQQARSWELRAATSFARFLAARDRRDEAKTHLVPSLAAITEGRESAELKEASALLESLG
jgi:predicted ATPase